MSNTDLYAAQNNDVIMDFDVVVSTPDGEQFTAVIPVNLRFPESEGVTSLSDRAMDQARKRAIRLALRDFPQMVAGKRLVAGVPELLHEGLVREGARSKWRR